MLSGIQVLEQAGSSIDPASTQITTAKDRSDLSSVCQLRFPSGGSTQISFDSVRQEINLMSIAPEGYF
jgi:hypothetical protein